MLDLVFALDPLRLPPLVPGLAGEVAHQVDEVARHRRLNMAAAQLEPPQPVSPQIGQVTQALLWNARLHQGHQDRPHSDERVGVAVLLE